jgi:mannitol/fructose-specific phosphotransferase system IIA component (Ntr-type)
VFARLHPRFGTPYVSLLLTGVFIIASLFVQLRILVEAASLVVIITNILACLSVLVLRASRLQSYRPSFRAPLYPWIQLAGIVILALLIIEMGLEAILISLGLIAAGTLTWWLYGRLRGYREYALLHLVENITNRRLTRAELERELREIIRERDELKADRFDALVERAAVLDIEGPVTASELFERAAGVLSRRLRMKKREVLTLLEERESQSHTAISADTAIPHLVVPGERRFAVLLARCRDGVRFSEQAPAVRAVFVLAGSQDERNFHLVSLVAIAQLVQEPDFFRRWMEARNEEGLRNVVLLGKRRRPDEGSAEASDAKRTDS